MDYTTLDIAKLLLLATVEKGHAARIQPSIDRWIAYEVQLQNSGRSLESESSNAGSQWPDAAGQLFLQRANENVATIRQKQQAVAGSNVVGRLGMLRDGIGTAYTEVLDAYNQYANKTYPDQAAMDAAAKQAAQTAGAALNTVATLFVSAGAAVNQASGPGIVWNGPKTGESAPPGGGAAAAAAPSAAPGGAPSGAPAAAPGGAPAGAPAGGAAAESAAAGGADPAGAPGGAAAAPSPTGSLSPAGAGPSLAGLTAPTPIGNLPTVSTPISPNLPTPIAGGLIPPVTGLGGNIRPTGGLSPGAIRPTGGLGSAAITSVPKAAGATVAASATPTAGQAPVRAETTGAQTANRPLGTSGTTPMMPPMSGGLGGAGAAGGAPRAGTADPAARQGRPPRTVPGVPPKLRGRAGKLDGKSTFLTPAGRSPSGRRDEDPESTTVQLLDEDLWQVAPPR